MIPALIYLALLIATINTSIISDVRYSDFVKTISLKSIPLKDDSLTLEFTSLNQTFSIKLFKNIHLVLADTTVQIHNVLSGKVEVRPVIAHAYHGNTIQDDGLEVGWARILFHNE